MLDTYIKNNLLWTEGRAILLATLLPIPLLGLLFPALLIPLLVFFIFSVYFFRFPTRRPKLFDNRGAIISPSDGKVVDIIHDPTGTLEGRYTYRVSIFLSPMDVHVNWTPAAGDIESVEHKSGLFKVAWAPESSELNERNDVILNTEHGSILVRQIAGTVARRIVCWAKQGDSMKTATPYGMIKFGSRIDLFLPANAALAVRVGERVYGGQTVIGGLSL